MLLCLGTQCLDGVLRRLLLLRHCLQQRLDLFVKAAHQVAGTLMQVSLRGTGGLIHLLLTMFQLLEDCRELLTQHLNGACNFRHGFLLTLADVLLDRLNKSLEILSHCLLASLALSKQLLQLLGHSSTCPLPFVADTGNRSLEIDEHLVHPCLHGVLSGLHIGE
ncbi:hypothetical protein D3C86_1410950 [compost metagenome]